MLFRAALGWLVLMILAIATGAFREGVIVPRIGSAVGHIVGTLLFCAVILLATGWMIPWLAPRDHAEAWRIGWIWGLGLRSLSSSWQATISLGRVGTGFWRTTTSLEEESGRWCS